ncbi:MAG TPA: Gfo/Idh/MocA family oxidoreductase [Pirellulaceae bacterium]|nr:Gfo/Idh/MocA family oxidoreductase [Pirellulaceae bacterium]
MSDFSRRSFLESSAAAGAAWAAGSYFVSEAQAQEPKSANERIAVAIMGVNGRGGGLAKGYMAQTNCEIAYICDVDENAMARTAKTVGDGQERKPQAVKDFRQALDDKSLDVLVCAAPNHWHAPATILGCSAGKHVYVEKPCSHNPREGEMAVEAARKYKRVVQMGTQRRTWPGVVEGIKKVHDGAIGPVHYSRTWYTNRRPSIGFGKPATIPTWLDWELWQGPAPEKPFVDNVVHYNWHWKWHWGNGELGNNGIHALDVARWGMQVDYPVRVTSGGGKYRHEDDQQTPDTHLVTYDFPGKKTITWEGLSWSPYGPGGSSFGISFHGEEGTLVIQDSGYTIYDMKNKESDSGKGNAGDTEHIANFLACVKSGARPNADIEHGHKSTLLCHLGNIAHRVNRVLTTDAKNGHIQGDDEAMALWQREYRKGWEPVV